MNMQQGCNGPRQANAETLVLDDVSYVPKAAIETALRSHRRNDMESRKGINLFRAICISHDHNISCTLFGFLLRHETRAPLLWAAPLMIRLNMLRVRAVYTAALKQNGAGSPP